MNNESANLKINNNEAAHRWEAQINQHIAMAEYQRRGDAIFFIHTQVPPELEGQGIASRLVQAALNDARDRQLAVIPFCPFVADYIRRHPSYKALVHTDYRDLVGDSSVAHESADGA